MGCMIVPPYLLLRLAQVQDPRLATAAAAARKSLQHDAPFRSIRKNGLAPHESGEELESRQPMRTIFDSDHTETLPGRVVRSEGDPPTNDVTVTEAYDGLGHTHKLFRAEFSRASIDDNNLSLLASVHYGTDYDNAFWDGRRMVFGDGDGQVFNRFTSSLSVIGHELAHGVMQYTANLVYHGQSGALNESISDVFGALVEQHAANQAADAASWLIGEGLFTDQVQGSALRSMRAPGTAYDDDVLGTDPQPGHFSDYIETTDDNGGVHLNSGIPNRAFYLVASALGGHAWERAGRIWYNTINGGTLSADSDFERFAEATTATAAEHYGANSKEQSAVAEAWREVGITQ